LQSCKVGVWQIKIVDGRAEVTIKAFAVAPTVRLTHEVFTVGSLMNRLRADFVADESRTEGTVICCRKRSTRCGVVNDVEIRQLSWQGTTPTRARTHRGTIPKHVAGYCALTKFCAPMPWEFSGTARDTFLKGEIAALHVAPMHTFHERVCF
jgi:hypothetical protein